MKKTHLLIMTVVLLLVVGGTLLGSKRNNSPLDRLIINEKLAQIISNEIKSFKNDSASFLLLSGKRLEGNIVILYGGNGLVDPESNILLYEPFLYYDKKGSIMYEGRSVSLSYMGADTVPNMKDLFDESVLNLPFPNPTENDDGYCGTHRTFVYKSWLITQDRIIDFDDSNFANDYPRQFEYYAGGDEYFLRISPTTNTYELFDGIKEVIGSYISHNDTMRLSPKYYYYTSSLLHTPVLLNANDNSENNESNEILVRKTESEIDYYSEIDRDSSSRDGFLEENVKLWRIHRSGKESYE